MAKLINIQCENCTFADEYGRACKFVLMFPVMLVLANKDNCPNRKPKTQEQLKQQLKAKGYE